MRKHPDCRYPAQKAIALFCLLICIVMLAACAGRSLPKGSGTPAASGKAPRGTKPYTIRGQTYYPLLSAHGFQEEGVASWYGSDFHGKLTANGERYDMYSMTAAHKLLPFNTRIRVTNLSNNRSIIVRVNDRGPFVASRIVDLTRAGAEEIGMLGPGTARVRLESIGTVPGLKDGDLTGNFYIQVGAFLQKSNAQGLVAKLHGQGRKARTYYAEQVGYWRVQIGPYPSLVHAEEAGTALMGQYPGNFVVAN